MKKYRGNIRAAFLNTICSDSNVCIAFGKETKITAQTYHAYESTFLEDYKKNYNEYPILSDNCDPDYKE
jgi:hypothetical protein